MAPVVDAHYGVTYVLGETNSISCQGRDGVSNVFGAALWYLDYTLFVAADIPAVGGMYFHMGTPYRYSLWAPYEGAANDAALVRPAYYGAWMLATAIGNGAPPAHTGDGGELLHSPSDSSVYFAGDTAPQKVVHALLAQETLTAYALYRTAARTLTESIECRSSASHHESSLYTSCYVYIHTYTYIYTQPSQHGLRLTNDATRSVLYRPKLPTQNLRDITARREPQIRHELWIRIDAIDIVH